MSREEGAAFHPTPKGMGIPGGNFMGIMGRIDDAFAVPMAASQIADWFGVTTPSELAAHAVAGTDLTALLPENLVIPPLHPKVIGLIVPFLRGIRGRRKNDLYAKILVYLGDPRNYGNRFAEHCLVMAWGLPGAPVQAILARFPVLSAISSVWPWYVSHMDRVITRLIHQLEGGAVTNDRQPADGGGDSIGGVNPGGPDDRGVRDLEAGGIHDDMAFAVSSIGYGGGFDADAD